MRKTSILGAFLGCRSAVVESCGRGPQSSYRVDSASQVYSACRTENKVQHLIYGVFMPYGGLLWQFSGATQATVRFAVS